MSKLQKLVLGALLASLCCMGTLVIQIPSPMNGYVNMGDCFVLLSGWLLGPVYGFIAAGVGSALADLLAGYVHYVPATFLIKGLVALLAWTLNRLLSALPGKKLRLGRTVSALAAEAVMVLGYFAWAALLFGEGLAAAASIPGNIVQGLAGVVLSALLMEVLQRTKLTKDFAGGEK